MKEALEGLSEIRGHFFRDGSPVWYVCATPYTLLGMDEWVRGFRWVTYADCFDGAHPRVFVPPQSAKSTFPFETLEEMNNHLLSRPDVQAHVRRFGPGRLALLMFDERTEELARELELELIFPPAALRRKVDDKVEATRIAERAGVACVPNVLGRVRSWEDLTALAASVGTDLVIQTPFGDSGTTTFFVASREDFEACRETVAREAEVKVMRRIRPRQAAIEACVTRQGTIVGPLATEIVGFKDLTPYEGGWAGNEIAPGAFTPAQRNAASERTRRFGDTLADLGYRGYFEIDWLIDQDSGEIYLGEVNPRLTGASPLTNLAAFAHADAPLFLFHLLEYSGLPFKLDVDGINRRWADPRNMDDWGQLIIKITDGPDLRLTAAPPSGVWRLEEDGTATFRFAQTHRRTVEGEHQGFFLRIPTIGDEVGVGDDLGILVLRGRLMTENGELTERTRRWIAAIRAQFAGDPC